MLQERELAVPVSVHMFVDGLNVPVLLVENMTASPANEVGVPGETSATVAVHVDAAFTLTGVAQLIVTETPRTPTMMV